jgi:hypothetical protein
VGKVGASAGGGMVSLFVPDFSGVAPLHHETDGG